MIIKKNKACGKEQRAQEKDKTAKEAGRRKRLEEEAHEEKSWRIIEEL